MPDKVLVAVDGSPLSKRALRYALETFPDAAFTSIHVINPVDSLIDVEAGGLSVANEWHDNAQDRASEIHTTATNLAAEHGVELATVTEVGRPGKKILAYADDNNIDQIVNNIDQIVIGSHGRSGLDRVLLGSVAETVTRRAQIPVAVIA
jgi:nucleotide-binding universal stress UspA family protein